MWILLLWLVYYFKFINFGMPIIIFINIIIIIIIVVSIIIFISLAIILGFLMI